MPLPRRLADFRLELAEAIESFGENWFSWGNWLGGFPITWNPGIGKESLKINKLGQVLLEKVERLFRDLPQATRPSRAPVGSEHGFHGVFHVAFG
jgi:hypothetical protein